MAVRRVKIDDELKGRTTKSSGRSNMKRICEGPCGEPSDYCKKIDDKWICDSCETRMKEDSRPVQKDREFEADVRNSIRNREAI